VENAKIKLWKSLKTVLKMCNHTSLISYGDGTYKCVNCGKYLKTGEYHNPSDGKQGWYDLVEMSDIDSFHKHDDMPIGEPK
jgi:hypothetical protein